MTGSTIWMFNCRKSWLRSLLIMVALWQLSWIQQVTAQEQLRKLRELPSALYVVPGDGTQVHFRLEKTNDSPVGEIGYFYVDGIDGHIVERRSFRRSDAVLDSRGRPRVLRPGVVGYAELALHEHNLVPIFRRDDLASSERILDRSVEVPGDRFVAFYFVADSSVANWRYAAKEDRPEIELSTDALVASSSNRKATFWIPIDPGVWTHGYALNSPAEQHTSPQARSRLLVNAIPILAEDTLTVMPSGKNFEGVPASITSDVGQAGRLPDQAGWLDNDYGSEGRPLWITHVRIEPPGLEEPVPTPAAASTSSRIFCLLIFCPI